MFPEESGMKSKRTQPDAATKSAGKAKSPKARKRVYLVDDHPMMLDAMRLLIDNEPELECCGGARTAEEAVSQIPQCQPDVVVTDITLPNRSGLDLIKDLTAMQPELLVLVYSMHDESFYAERALRAGARGYLMKEAGSEKMLEAIRHVLAGEVFVSPRMAAKILNLFSKPQPRGSDSTYGNLTDREFEIFRLIGRGKSTKEIAAQLHLSHKTVAVHRGHIKEKLQLASATELMHQAIQWTEAQSPREPI
jgi:DNA-binding NarL/FixJ family response regulator